MPTPTASQIKASAISYLPAFDEDTGKGFVKPITEQLDDFLDMICDGVASSWSTWASSAVYSGDSVTGAGVGTWTGTGGGGAFAPSSMTVNVSSLYNTEYAIQFATAVENGWKSAIDKWISSYSFIGVTFFGSTTMIPPSTPGVFTAINTPSTSLALFGTAPSNVGNAIKSGMQGQNADLAQAIGDALETEFTKWASTALVTNCTVTGSSAPPTGSGSGTSAGGVIA